MTVERSTDQGGRQLTLVQPELLTKPGEQLYREFFDCYSEKVTVAMRRLDIEIFAQAVDAIYLTRGRGQIFTAGNGGSATIADHLAHNLNWDSSALVLPGEKLSARCLNIDSSEVTARGNDRHFAYSFATMLGNHARRGDVFVAISASGNSDNIIKALKQARLLNLTSIFIGRPESLAKEEANICITIDSDDQQIVEDVSQSVVHMIIRALGVKLNNLDKSALLTDIAHLRDKMPGISSLSVSLGEPEEMAARTRAEFETALASYVEGRIARSTRVAFPGHNSCSIEPHAVDFTSFIRRVTLLDQTLLAKFSLGVTKPRLIHERSSEGLAGFARITLMDHPAVSDEFLRAKYLRSIFPDNIPQPQKLVDGVAFYTFINGKSLEQAMLDGDPIPMARIGRLLRDWHEFFRRNQPPTDVIDLCKGTLDRLDGYKKRYSTAEGIQKEFEPLFVNGYLDPDSDIGVLGLLEGAVSKLNQSGVLELPRDTWGYGDFKPENVLLSNQGGIFLVDNDLHLKPALVDVAKMVSRSLAICFDGSGDPGGVSKHLSEFMTGYSTDWEMPPYLAEIIAIDMITILAGYSTIRRDLLPKSTHLAQVFLKKPKAVVGFINYLTIREHHSLGSTAEYFQEATF